MAGTWWDVFALQRDVRALALVTGWTEEQAGEAVEYEGQREGVDTVRGLSAIAQRLTRQAGAGMLPAHLRES